MAIRERVYNGRDNSIVLGLLVDGSEWSAAAITRVVLTLEDDDGNPPVVIDSDSSPSAFDWTDEAAVLDNVVPVLTMTLGAESIPARDDYVGTLVVYATTLDGNNGTVWDDKLSIEVLA